MTHVRTIACAGLLALGSLTGCSNASDGPSDSGQNGATAAGATTAITAGPGGTAEGSLPVEGVGVLLFSVEEVGVRIDAYERGRSTSDFGAGLTDDTGKSVWPSGSPVVYITYVITNNTGKAIYTNSEAATIATVASIGDGGLGSASDLLRIDSDDARELGISDMLTASSRWVWR